MKPKLIGITNDRMESLAFIEAFLFFFPKTLWDIIVDATNSNLQNEDVNPIDFGEFLKFVGLWLFMATISGCSRHQFWSVLEVHTFEGAPYRYHSYMSFNSFEAIRRCLGYTTSSKPSFLDRFWEVRFMIAEWNSRMIN